MAKLDSHLWISRHGIYYLRIKRNGKESKRSLGTRDPEVAKACAYKFGVNVIMAREWLGFTVKVGADGSQEYVTDGTEADAIALTKMLQVLGFGQPQTPAPAAPVQQHAQAPAPSWIPREPLTIKAAVELYLDKRKNQLKPSGLAAYTTHLRYLVKQFKQDTMLHDVLPSAITDSFTRLENNGKSLKTISSYRSTWKMAWEWWKEHGHTKENPVTKLTYGKQARDRLRAERDEPRIPWSAEDLYKWFSIEHLNTYDRPEYTFMPVLGLCTGARREALAQLRIDDFKEYASGCWSIYFDPEFDKLFRERDIPMHPLLIEIGFLDYIADIKAMGLKDDRIFPHFNEGSGKVGHYFGKRFGEYRTALGVNPGSDFHAFRTTLISILALNSSPPDPRRAFVGHETNEKIDVHLANYTKPTFGPERLAAEVLPYIDFSAIGFTWPGWKYQPGVGVDGINKLFADRARKQARIEREESDGANRKQVAKKDNATA